VVQADLSLAKGAAFLLAKQAPDGSWMASPAITALNSLALAYSPDAAKPEVRAAINRGLDAVIKNAQPDGSIFNKENEEYPNYSTAISTIALALLNRPQDQKVLRAARAFLLGSQFKDAAAADGSFGGIGYGKEKRPDLSNTQWGLEALYLTEHLDKDTGTQNQAKAKEGDLAWDRALQFLSTCQNLKETNTQVWVAADPDNRGGFVYMPGQSKAGKLTKDGKASPSDLKASEDGDSLRSYGSMTYAGLKSMIYAKLSKDDPRVKAAADWAARHYTFDENPGMKDSGLFYYLHTSAKALAALGEENLTLPDGSRRAWRQDLLKSLIAKQRPGGEWQNANARWWESAPELVTGYSMIALGVTLDRTPASPAGK